MKSAAQLRKLLQDIDHRGYPAYKDTRGSYQFDGFILNIDHVQGDPFASPSKVSLLVDGKKAGFPEEYRKDSYNRIALQDHLTRLFVGKIEKGRYAAGSGKSGLVYMSRPGQTVLERTACRIDEKSGDILVRLEVGFPANGRTIRSEGLIQILFELFPQCVREVLTYASLDADKVRKVIWLAEDQQTIRVQIRERGLCAFIADGAILPRETGVSDRPMKQAVAFQSPEEQRVTLELPHKGKITGMGIPKGITLIVGGGYHGKSTLLMALEQGVYEHIAGDGREYVITDDTAVKIRAEDGRSVTKTDISMFISNLPNGKDTKVFYTEDASGSTSQAANMIEALEAGTGLFLIDEDTSATNFMVRDELMQRVIHRDQEPITPFVERARELYEKHGVSTILVAGSSGAYFYIADQVIQMDRYEPKDITKLAKEEAARYAGGSTENVKKEQSELTLGSTGAPCYQRCPRANREFADGERIKMKTLGLDGFQINRETVDVRYLEQLVDSEQVTALAYYLKYAEKHLFNGKRTLQEAVEELWKLTQTQGLGFLAEGSYLPSGLAQPRKQEVLAALNRYRGLRM